MKIAVASNGLEVSPYFECCTNYNFFVIDNGMIMDYRNFPILIQQGLSAIGVLRELDIDIIIVGCMKITNREQIENAGIEVVCGGKGDAKVVVEDYLSEEYIRSNSYCEEYKKVYGEEGTCKESLAGTG